MAKVSIVVISHSKQLAEGIVELVSQTKQKDVTVVAAGGTEEEEIGTSVEMITKTVKEVYNEAGVLLLFDLGSAFMNAELAMEMLPDMEGNVQIADAPIVEGTYIAAVEAGLGCSLEEAKNAAEKAKTWKKTDG
ncbi:dihydroxyacetone kinase phosphoryl donor subunit DhaM [Alteribacillus bidgolensis]|uniref:phosphoenolpyruvate--glycerone phosphotransferase n=1 Tax=Alteribacillus bidgolensis TaxID=930129 RepID=A0A1G8LYU1_9BACI|nr:dihydroxyacetone kinase phosphoryl donor subunit DhaM [Alteribacillus bidgolensis]SDI60826.1 dihydroxyacetone kinase DhaM subunit [Alteribacillus bidgolensis]